MPLVDGAFFTVEAYHRPMTNPTPTNVTSPSTLAPSFIRTYLPLVAGLLGTFLLKKFGVEVDTATAGAVVTVVISAVYYTIARFLEVFASEKWGYVLGFRAAPTYGQSPEHRATD